MNTRIPGASDLLLACLVSIACTPADEAAVSPMLLRSVDAGAPLPLVRPSSSAEPTKAEPIAAPDRWAIPVAADAPQFERVAVGGGDTLVALLQTTDGALFAATGPVLARLGTGGAYEPRPEWSRGIDDTAALDSLTSGYDWWQAVAMGGTWPEGAYLVLSPESGSRGDDSPHETYRRLNGTWTRVATGAKRFDWYPRSFGAWKDGSLLALRAFDPHYTAYDDEGSPSPREAKTVAAAIAAEKRLVVLRGRPKAPGFGKRDVRAFASLPTGEIYAAIAEGDVITMLHHDGVTASERALTLPGPGVVGAHDITVVATGDDRVWVFGSARDGEDDRAYVARYDGRTWSQVSTPCVGPASSGSIDDAGNAYFVCDVQRTDVDTEAALLRVKGDLVEELPTGILPYQVVARRSDDIWVVNSPFGLDVALVYSGAKVPSPHVLPSREEVARTVYEWSEPHEMAPACAGVWIPLTEGADRAAAEATLERLAGDEGYPELYEARVAGSTAFGVRIQGVSDKTLPAATKRVVAALGTAAGTPTCNQRPSVEPEG